MFDPVNTVLNREDCDVEVRATIERQDVDHFAPDWQPVVVEVEVTRHAYDEIGRLRYRAGESIDLNEKEWPGEEEMILRLFKTRESVPDDDCQTMPDYEKEAA